MFLLRKEVITLLKTKLAHQIVREAVKVCRKNGDTSNEAIIQLLREAALLRDQQISGIKAHVLHPASFR